MLEAVSLTSDATNKLMEPLLLMLSSDKNVISAIQFSK